MEPDESMSDDEFNLALAAKYGFHVYIMWPLPEGNPIEVPVDSSFANVLLEDVAAQRRKYYRVDKEPCTDGGHIVRVYLKEKEFLT